MKSTPITGCLAALAAIGWLSVGALAAPPKNVSPNHENAFLPLAVHGEGISSTLQDGAQDRFLAAGKAIQAAQALQQRGQLRKVDPVALGKANVAAKQMRRLAEQLGALGEPAGAEFQRRAVVNSPTFELAQSFAATPEGGVYVAKVRQIIANSANARTNAIRKAEELGNRGKWEEAEKTLYDILDKLDAITIFLPTNEIDAIYLPFGNIQLRVNQEMGRIRHHAGREILNKRLDDQLPDFDALLADIREAADSVRDSGQATIGDQERSGPETFAHFVGEWNKVHAAIQRVHGLSLALRGEGVGMYSMPMVTGPMEAHPAVQHYQGRFHGDIARALAGIVEADASHASPADVPALYDEYLRAAALPAARASDGGVAKTFDQALLKLAARSPQFRAEVQGYTAATDELLRWRARTAGALAAAQQEAYPSVERPFHAATTSKLGYNALFYEREPEYGMPRILAPTPDFLPVASQQLLGTNVRLPRARGLAGGKSAATAMHLRIYGTFKPFPDLVAAEVAALQSDLLTSETLPPLSLSAAMALETARLGDYEQIGGEISGMHLEGFVTRLAALPDAASSLFPLGYVPTETAPQSLHAPLSLAVVRFDLKPAWVQHRAFFVQLAR
jgi:hypothetical protein